MDTSAKQIPAQYFKNGSIDDNAGSVNYILGGTDNAACRIFLILPY